MIKNTFKKLKVDHQGAAFAKEILGKRLLLRLKKSKCTLDKQFFKNVNLLDKKNVIFNPEGVDRTEYVEKRDIYRSTLYSFNRHFKLVHADVGNLEFLGKNATFPRYVLVLVDLFSFKTYTYLMRSRKQLSKSSKSFMRRLRTKEKVRK